MASYITKRWVSEATSGIPRAERRSCEYRAYLPDRLADRVFRLDGDVAADVADAEAAIAKLDGRAGALTDTEALARMLLRAESVASSRIEGLEIGPRRLMRAEAARQMGKGDADMRAEEILGSIDAMGAALQVASDGRDLAVDDLLEIHRCLMANTRMPKYAGETREAQNWVGGNIYNPCSAAYVPPPPGEVNALLEDLCEFCNSDMLPAVVQAAIAHAQFETIHPFVDGNGRVGRALIHLILRRRGVSKRVLPPVSLVLATRAADYIGGLTGYRYEGEASSLEAHDGANLWIASFAAACVRAVGDAVEFEERCKLIQTAWRSRLGRIRAGSSTDLLVRTLPGMPVVSVNSATAALGRSKPQVNEAVARLVDAGILSQITVGRRNRAFEAIEIIDAFASLERQLASPEGDTRVSPPVRPVPARR